MYKRIIRPILFCFPPETIHRIVICMLKAGGSIPGVKGLLKKFFTVRHPLLEREVFGMKFPNPVGLAAGLDKNAEVFLPMAALGFGFVEIGTVTPKAQLGNPKPRLFRLKQDNALINRMGFNNNGVEAAVKKLKNRKWKVIVGGNLGKNTLTPNEKAPADYLQLFRRLYDHVDYFVINVSCPNIANLRNLQNQDSLKKIIEGLTEFRRGQNNYRPILMKISPDLSFEQIDEAVAVMKSCNLDGIVAVNTTTSREGLSLSAEAIANIGNGGLSGAPLTKRALEVVKYVRERTQGQYPIIGVGGIMTVEDALAMLDAGASLIQIYSGFIYNGPAFVKEICKAIIARAETRES